MGRQQEKWGFTDNDVLLYMLKLANDLLAELRSDTDTMYQIRSGYHKLQLEEIGEHVYYTQMCRSVRNYHAIIHPDQIGNRPEAHVWRIYFGCGTEHQRWDVASLVSTIKDGQAS